MNTANKMMKPNQEIREEIRKYGLTYADLLPHIENYSHTTRIVEELALPLSFERQKVYLLAIKKAKEKKKKEFEELFKN